MNRTKGQKDEQLRQRSQRPASRARWLPWLALAWAGPLALPPAHAQFNPQGRGKPAAGASQRKSPAQPAPRSQATSPSTSPSTSSPGRPGSEPAGPNRAELIERYTQVVLKQPGSEFPLRRLAELVRERDGQLDGLLEEFEERARKAGGARYEALVALAGLYEQAGRFEDASRTYGEAAELKPNGTIAPLAQARLLERAGDTAKARTLYESVLPRVTGAERELVLRDLMRLYLDAKDVAGARAHHRTLVREAQGSLYVRAELGRELLRRGELKEATTEFRDVVKAAQGDSRALAPALRDLGAALVAAGETSEAMEVLGRARSAATGQPGLQREIDELLVTAYRRAGRLPELVREFETSAGQNFDRLRTLGKLYEETGELEKALGAYRRALTLKKADVETRLKVVQLLELSGELDRAIEQYEELVRAHPSDAALVFRFAEALLQRGERSRALGHLDRLEREVRGDEDTLVALTDFYERVGETDRASQVLGRLSKTALRDPRHLVELGSRYWRDGKRDEAKRTWNRILTAQPDRARALVTLGEVYLDHDLTGEALEALREAVKVNPRDTRIKRSLAIALERVGASSSQRERAALWEEARKLWEELLAGATRDGSAPSQALAREARSHIVKSWQRTGQLQTRLSPLAARLRSSPPDLEAGRLLAEADLYLRRYAEAERTLRIVVRHAPGDVSSLVALERSLVAQEKWDNAIDVLQKLIAADPQKARDYYQRAARYAAEQYQDERAIEFAVRAVELSPDDAEGHSRLGEMYRRRGHNEHAIASFRQAIAKNDRLYPAYFELAELLVSQGEEAEADRWLRRVVRSAPDDEFVARAARLSLQLNLSRGTLTELEADLLPLALGRPGKPLYRRLLVEVYSTQAFPLVHRLSAPSAEEREQAARQLTHLGERAVKPLLDALGDERPEQQRTALELLAHVHARGATPALLAYAAGDAPPELRERAAIAAGAAEDERSLSKLEALVFEGSQAKADGVAIAAAWGISRLPGRAAAATRQRLMETTVPELRTLGLLGSIRAARSRGANNDRALSNLDDALGKADAGPLPRAAAAYGWGVLARTGSPAAASSLLGLLDGTDPLVRAHALTALATLRHSKVEPALAEALTSPEPIVREAALRAAAVYASPPSDTPRPDPLAALPDGAVDVPALLESSLPPAGAPEDLARALVSLREPLEEAALLAIRSSGARAITVAQALTARDGAPAYGALTERLEETHAELRHEAEQAALRITLRVGPAYLALMSHDSAEVRSASVAVLGLLPEDDAARSALFDALTDKAPEVQNAALTALGRSTHGAARRLLIDVLETAADWRLRRGAARALGRSLQAQPGTKPDPKAVEVLRRAAQGDQLRVVRDTATQALQALEATLRE